MRIFTELGFLIQPWLFVRVYLGYVQRRGVAVVETDSGEVCSCDLGVFLHVRPQIRTVLRLTAVSKLHAVSPTDQLSPYVHVRA